jgi:hypothetical protein
MLIACPSFTTHKENHMVIRPMKRQSIWFYAGRLLLFDDDRMLKNWGYRVSIGWFTLELWFRYPNKKHPAWRYVKNAKVEAVPHSDPQR